MAEEECGVGGVGACRKQSVLPFSSAAGRKEKHIVNPHMRRSLQERNETLRAEGLSRQTSNVSSMGEDVS